MKKLLSILFVAALMLMSCGVSTTDDSLTGSVSEEPNSETSNEIIVDSDSDGIIDDDDNCVDVANSDQIDTDKDNYGDVCDEDDDADGITDAKDNCSLIANKDQLDSDIDNVGDECDEDDDNDSVLDVNDNCPKIINSNQINTDLDVNGDECDDDDDNDNVPDVDDICPKISDPNQTDLDNDGQGDECDTDDDADGVLDPNDNCPYMWPSDSNQADNDDDGFGDICDEDDDNDNILDEDDNCEYISNNGQEDIDDDEDGDVCDDDIENDGILNDDDNCPLVTNPGQEDQDSDDIGDACDPDIDGDEIDDSVDNCPSINNPSQEDKDFDDIGDACDDDVTDLYFELSNAKVLLFAKSSVDAVSSSGVEFKTDFFILDEADNVLPAINPTKGYSIIIDRHFMSPTGELYITFPQSYVLDNTICKTYSINLQTSDATCVTEEYVTQVEFTNNGDVYYSTAPYSHDIKKYDKESGEVTSIFSGEDMAFTLSEFQPADDGSIFVLGQLAGTSHHFFRFFPASIFGVDSFEAQCMAGTVSGGKQIFLANDSSLYVNSKGSPVICDGLERREIYRGTFAGGEVTFTPFPDDIYAVSLAEDSEHGVYAVGNVRYNGKWNTVTRLSAEPYESIFMSLAESPLFGLKKTYIFAAGMNESFKRVFLRKNIFGNQAEIDMLGASNLIVHAYDVESSGDVYFGAYDLGSSKNQLFKYNDGTTVLETISELSSELKDVFCLE